MPPTQTEIFLRAGLALETLEAHHDIRAALERGGVQKAALDQGRALFNQALETLEHLSELGDDFTVHNQTARAIDELNSWRETALHVLARAHGEPLPERWPALSAQDVGCSMGELLALMKAWRITTALRTDPDAWEQIKARRPRLEDDLQRCYVLMRKTIRTVDKLFLLTQPSDKERKHVETLEQLSAQLEAWLHDTSTAAAEHLSSAQLGLLGALPEGVGLPFGGTAFDVMRHRRATGVLPDDMTTPAPPSSGWGVGTQRNRENYWERDQAKS